jgi:hypothetical protein
MLACGEREVEGSEGAATVVAQPNRSKRHSRDASKGNSHRSEAVEENNKLIAEFKEVLKSIHGFDSSNHRRQHTSNNLSLSKTPSP